MELLSVSTAAFASVTPGTQLVAIWAQVALLVMQSNVASQVSICVALTILFGRCSGNIGSDLLSWTGIISPSCFRDQFVFVVFLVVTGKVIILVVQNTDLLIFILGKIAMSLAHFVKILM